MPGQESYAVQLGEFAASAVVFRKRWEDAIRFATWIGSPVMNSIMGTPEYKLMTIRNWATTTRLLALLDDQVT